MSNYSIQRIQQIEKDHIQTGTFLWAFHVDKVPPHVGISIDGFYFSMKAEECDFNLEVETIYQVVQRKKIPAFLVPIQKTGNLAQLQSIFKEYGTNIHEGDSCMTPVLRFLEENEKLLLEDLLKRLNQTNRIQTVLGIHLPDTFENVPHYTHEEVQSHIAQLKHVNR